MPWNPEQYEKFKSERSAPFDDLLKLVDIRPGLRVVDLGCGTGELTRRLADALPESRVLGLDNSAQMLEKAESFKRPGLDFRSGDLAQLDGVWDLVFSNAALQWSGDHPRLLAHLFSRLAPAGQIAVQVPSNFDHISHRLIQQTAREMPYREQLGGYEFQRHVLSIDSYARLLFELGAREINVFEKVFTHVLQNADAVLEWITGTALVPYLERLGKNREAFREDLRIKLRYHLPGSPVFYPFKRTFFSARRPG